MLRAGSRFAGVSIVVAGFAALQLWVSDHAHFDGGKILGLARVQLVPSAEAKGLRGPQSVAPVAEKLIDAVVNISTTQVNRGPQGVPLPKVPKGSPFEEFFEEFFNGDGQGSNSQRKVSSLGSGFVIDGKAGIIVTNQHVIADADEIVVNFHDGSKLKVDKILGTDAATDLAVLKVSPIKPLVDVSFGRSGVLRVGDWVMAIGNPFGLGGSVTVGIISAKQRDIKSGPYDEYLQTDASINKGNSGGPLFNMNGEVIGINTAIISPSGGSIGIGFAVPSDTAVTVVEQLIKYGEVRRSWLGVKIQTVSDEIAESLGVPANTGALVSAVEVSSPAEKGGLLAGDVILKFNGEVVTRMRSLPGLVARAGVGRKVEVDVVRDGSRKVLQVTLGRLKDGKTRLSSSAGSVGENDKGTREALILGMKLSTIDDGLRKKYRLSEKLKGVVVVEINPDSEAMRRQIKEGDVIVEAGQERVNEPSDVQRSIEKVLGAGRKAVLLRVEDSKGELRFVAVPIP